MSLFLLDAVFWIFGIRGHIPLNEDFLAATADLSTKPER